MLGTVEQIEAWWIAVTAIGAALNLWAMADAIADERARVRYRRNGLIAIASRASVIASGGLLLVQLLLLAVGLEAATLPPPPPHKLTEVELVFDVALFGIALVMVLLAVNSRVARRKMLRYDHLHG